jgi:cation/acetate symporter
MFLVSTQPQLFAAKIGEGSVITIGWPIAALIVVCGWLLTGVYVNRANGEFDSITEEVLKEARK